MDIGENIRTIRRARGLSQSELAKMVGTTSQSITQYENNLVDIPTSKLVAIARSLVVPVSVILSENADERQKVLKENSRYICYLLGGMR